MGNSSLHIVVVAVSFSCTISCTSIPMEKSFDRWIEDGHITVYADYCEASAKTILQQDGSVFWSPYDSIGVFYGEYDLGAFIGLNEIPVKSTVFKSREAFVIGSIQGGSDDVFWSVNPYRPQNSSDGKSVTLVVPLEQTAVKGSFDPGSFPSIAKSDELEFSFKNVCGGLKFKVQNSGIIKVSFRGNNGETIAGCVKVSFDSNDVPAVVETVEPATQISLACPEGLIPGEWYYISILPSSLSKGFTIDLSDGISSVSYVSERNTIVKRSIFGVLSNLDEGLTFDHDWRNCDFAHRSLLLAIPNCSFPSVVINTEDGLISTARSQTYGNMEFLQMFANGPSPSEGIGPLLSAMNISTVPFEITDYRQKVGSGVTPYSTYLSTPSLYGTSSGLAINSYYNGDELNVETSIYLKEADEYKIAVSLVQDDGPYSIYTNGIMAGTIYSDGILECYLTDVLGDTLTAVSDNVVLYRSYKKVISDTEIRKNLRVLVYILRHYGGRQVVTNGNFGNYYVDNAISVSAGGEVRLPVVKKVNSEIGEFDYGGTIKL